MFEINDVVIIRKIGNKSSYEPVLNKKGIVVDFVNSYDALTMTTRRKYYVDVSGYKNEYQAQGYYVFEDETYLERAYQDARVSVPDELDAIAYALKREEFCIKKENKIMEILELYYDIKKGEIDDKYKKDFERLRNSIPEIKRVKEFFETMRDVKGLRLAFEYEWDKHPQYMEQLNKLNEKYDKKLTDLRLERDEISTMLSACETYEQKQNILRAYGVIDEQGKLRK